jgi:hypothetical protein
VRKEQKKELNTLDEADFVRDVQCCPKKVRAVHRNCLIERK